MGLRFRKSIKAGPLRVNLSKSGIGYSVGTKGLRYTKKAGGGSRTTASIPGTGISYVKDSKKSSKKTAAANYAPKYQSNKQQNAAATEKEAGGFAVMTGIRLLLIAFMGWAFCGIFPQLRSVWIALAILLTVPINILQAWISKTFQINTSEKFVFGLVFFLFGGLVHNNIIHLFVIAGLAIVYVFSFRYLKKETEDETEPQIQTNPNQQTEGSSPENRRPKYIKYLFLLVLVPVLLLSSCGGSEAPETEKSAPTVPETTIAATEMTEPTARETVVETTAAAEDPTETVIETTQIITEATQAATEATTQATEPTEEMVWIPTGGGTKYHSRSTCSNMSNPSNVPLSTAISRGFTPCKRCH